jgi:hypothetical protein
MTVTGCLSSATGSWSGVMDSPDKVGVRFVIEERDGVLSGRTFWEDPVTHEFAPEARFTGTRAAATATWKTETNVVVSGHFDGESFLGTIVFPVDGDEPSRTASVTLRRSRSEPCGATN